MSAPPRVWQILREVRSLGTWAAATAAAAPLVDLITRVGPPTPEGMPFITSFAVLVSILFAVQYWSARSRAVKARMRRALLTGIIGFIFYIFAFSCFVVRVPGGVVSTGIVVKPSVARLLGPHYSTRDALKDAEFEPRDVWEEWSVGLVEVSLVLTWLTMASSVALFIGGFSVLQYQSLHNAEPSRPRRGGIDAQGDRTDEPEQQAHASGAMGLVGHAELSAGTERSSARRRRQRTDPSL
jgi:hypothetical protein